MQPQIKTFKKVLVANRGEIAIRIFRALSELGISTVSIYSKEDRYSLFRSKADESYELDPDKDPVEAYMDIDMIIKIALHAGVDAIHPGYGFLAEDPELADACQRNNIAFIGPSSRVMNAIGDKLSSRKVAVENGVRIIPGINYAVKEVASARIVAASLGYPVIIKASNGGGGQGMRIVRSEEEMQLAFDEARDESLMLYGDDRLFIEKYFENAKHIEVQIMGDKYGNIVHLFERDCSIQRHHKKIVEYTPAFTLPESTRQEIFQSSLKMARAVGYESLGTFEFLISSDNVPYFIETNPRIQVEHTITELVTGVDLVQSQVLIAEGYALTSDMIGIYSQDDITCNGYAIEVRVNAEDPTNNFSPEFGEINVYRSATGNGIRLDDGFAYVGAKLMPYYDSLLVKVSSVDRHFETAARKLVRSIMEMRIRGVKTNTAFLVNILNDPVFITGKCTTSFIEDTPGLFEITRSQDRASKIIEFIGERIVNSNVGDKPFYSDRILPRFDNTAPVYGARDEFLKLGAKEFTKKVLRDKKLYVTDTTMRDGQQSLMSTRMRSKDLCGAAYATNAFMQNAFSVECWGGATYDTAYRFLKESPWKRLELLRERMPNTLIQMLLRSSNAVGYSNYPDNVVKEFIHVTSDHGIDVFRIFDSLNWIENMKMPIYECLSTGKIVEGSICYSGDLSNPKETKYTIDYYLDLARELEALGCHIIYIKDMASLLKPQAARELIAALKGELNVPVGLHTHDTSGLGVANILTSCSVGLDIADLAIESMSSLNSLPSMSAVVASLKGSNRDTMLNLDELEELSNYYDRIRPVYSQFESNIKSPNYSNTKYEIPGGQYSNLFSQVSAMGKPEDFEKVKTLYVEANELLGNIIKATPTSRTVGDLAIFMLKNDLTKENIFTKGADLSYPDSVVEFFMGLMGQPYGGFPEKLQKIVLKDKEPITVRPGSIMPPTDLDAVKQHLINKFHYEDATEEVMRQKTISSALYPRVYEDYCEHFQQYNDVTRLESHVYFYGLRPGEETYLNIGEGKQLLIKYMGRTAPDETNMVTLTFQVNGILRNVKILDKNKQVDTKEHFKVHPDNALEIGANIPGVIRHILVNQGDVVKENTPIITIEAMKMESTVLSHCAGTVERIFVKQGDLVETGDLIAVLSHNE